MSVANFERPHSVARNDATGAVELDLEQAADELPPAPVEHTVERLQHLEEIEEKAAQLVRQVVRLTHALRASEKRRERLRREVVFLREQVKAPRLVALVGDSISGVAAVREDGLVFELRYGNLESEPVWKQFIPPVPGTAAWIRANAKCPKSPSGSCEFTGRPTCDWCNEPLPEGAR